MTHSTPKRRAWRVAAVATAGALVAALGFAAPATAAPTFIDPTATGTITIHKLKNNTTTTPGNGTENNNLPAGSGEPLGGVQFSYAPITVTGLTINDQAWWEAIEAYSKNITPTPANITVGTAVDFPTVTDDTTGIATASNLPLGAYLVTEKSAPAGVKKADPFVVTVPITDPVNLNAWLYNVHVYPKNLQSEVEKTVEDDVATYAIGDTIDWTISSPTPTQATSLFAFKDELSEHLKINAPFADTVKLSIGSTVLVPADYEVVYPATTATLQAVLPAGQTAPAGLNEDDNTLYVVLTAAGLAKLTATAVLEGNDDISLTITTEVVSLPANGVIPNTGIIFPNDGFPIDGPGVPSKEVVSKFGELNILKVDAETAATLLAGAQFMVFKDAGEAADYAKGDATARAAAPLVNYPLEAYATATDAAVPQNPTKVFTTDGDGEAKIFGLRASNWEKGKLLTDSDDFQNYWLVEVKAPEGYVLSNTVFGGNDGFSILADNTTDLPSDEYTLENVKALVPPITGGTVAAWLFYIVGGLVLAGGALLVVRARRQNA